MPFHPLINVEIHEYYQIEPKFNGVYSTNSLPKIKDGADVINLEEFKSLGTYWIAFYVDNNNLIYFDNFAENIFQKKLKSSQKTKIS